MSQKIWISEEITGIMNDNVITSTCYWKQSSSLLPPFAAIIDILHIDLHTHKLYHLAQTRAV